MADAPSSPKRTNPAIQPYPSDGARAYKRCGCMVAMSGTSIRSFGSTSMRRTPTARSFNRNSARRGFLKNLTIAPGAAAASPKRAVVLHQAAHRGAQREDERCGVQRV
eukprot:CAMPEP_0205885554 /NCGR_PEP_ID=MMETSP1083-20121108/18739_1 /ASSEMBLY_ACC=CAM_ASM_000430 /TAXON_ID=97485 /ORGANISM="Prymnesium parvum, Strain Texoma1" /LENGTH=107 /DNA_ID=CAMNT_0053249081 /DNA_START=144 /DNA_END=465 /DNA_ORIENTATION=-